MAPMWGVFISTSYQSSEQQQLLPPITAHQGGFQDVAVHRVEHLLLFRARAEIERRI